MMDIPSSFSLKVPLSEVRTACELGLCYWSPELSDVQLVHKSGPRPTGTMAKPNHPQVREKGVQAAQAPRRESSKATLEPLWSQADHSELGAGQIYQCQRVRPLQERRLQVLMSLSSTT